MTTWSNCFLCLLWLMLAGKVRALIVLSPVEGSDVRAPHLVALNARAQALHFEHSRPDEENVFRHWFFEGRLRGVSKLRQPAVLADSGRHVIARFEWPSPAFALCVFLWLVAAIPWLSAWNWYWIRFNFRGARAAIRKRTASRRRAPR